MTAQHQDFLDMAKEMIGDEGRVMILVRITNTGRPDDPTQTKELMGIMGVQTEYREHDPVLVRKGDKRILIASTVDITSDMRIRDYETVPNVPLGQWQESYNGLSGEFIEYSLEDVVEVMPGETSILYKVQARV